MLEDDLSLPQAGSDSVPAFHEVCRSVLNPGSLSFVAANAPWNVVLSFEASRKRLASLSLGIASRMLVQQLRNPERNVINQPLFRFFQSLAVRTKRVVLLMACTSGWLGLNSLHVVRRLIPRYLQMGLSVNILRTVGTCLTDSYIRDDARSGNPIDARVFYPCTLEQVRPAQPGERDVAADILRALSISLPNDLSRLIFLATLRDNNSGHYFHPDLARRFSESVADRAMLACHRRIYKDVIALHIEDLTDQLDAYMATVPAPRKRLIESWTKLQAYRATIPIDTDSISAEIFFMKIDTAVAILGARLPDEVSG